MRSKRKQLSHYLRWNPILSEIKTFNQKEIITSDIWIYEHPVGMEVLCLIWEFYMYIDWFFFAVKLVFFWVGRERGELYSGLPPRPALGALLGCDKLSYLTYKPSNKMAPGSKGKSSADKHHTKAGEAEAGGEARWPLTSEHHGADNFGLHLTASLSPWLGYQHEWQLDYMIMNLSGTCWTG